MMGPKSNFDSECIDLERYLRQIILPEIGLEGQRRLAKGRILCIGAGGLGSAASVYLAAAGVGTIGIIDGDRVDKSNLHRQILHTSERLGMKKTESAVRTLKAINPCVEVVPIDGFVDRTNARQLVRDWDVVIDGSDNLPTRFTVSDACFFEKKPYVYGAVGRFEGQVSMIWPEKGGPCFRCLFPKPPPPASVPSCAETGILGVVPGVIGLLQALEALKCLVGFGEMLLGRLLIIDFSSTRFREILTQKDPLCPLCSESRSIDQVFPEHKDFPSVTELCLLNQTNLEIGWEDVRRLLAQKSGVLRILDVRTRDEFEQDHLPGSVNVPISELRNRAKELSPDILWLVVCRWGLLARVAVKVLRQLGLPHVVSVSGGLEHCPVEVERALRDLS